MKEFTKEDLQNHLMKGRDDEDFDTIMDQNFLRSERITCADGFSMSVQASHGAYCCPRTNIATWSQVEVGYPTENPKAFLSYAEDEDHPTETVYPYVPVELVVAEVNIRGGLKKEKDSVPPHGSAKYTALLC